MLAQKVAQVTGVGDVTVGGGSLPAVRVELQPYALMQYGIALDEVRQTISQANLLRPEGRRSRTATRFWQIQASDQLTKAKEYEPLIVTYRNGAPVRLADIAKVTDGVEDRFNSGYFNNKPAVLLIISRQPDANIIETVDAITDAAAGAARVPAGRRRAARRQRPLAGHPRHAARGRALAAHRRRPGHRRRAAVPGQLPRRA